MPPRRSTHPELRAVLDEHAAPRHCTTRQCLDALTPAEDTIAAARLQLAEDRKLLRRAELSAELNPDIVPKLDLYRRRLKEASAAVEAAAEPLERMTDALLRRDRTVEELREVLEYRDGITLPPGAG